MLKDLAYLPVVHVGKPQVLGEGKADPDVGTCQRFSDGLFQEGPEVGRFSQKMTPSGEGDQPVGQLLGLQSCFFGDGENFLHDPVVRR